MILMIVRKPLGYTAAAVALRDHLPLSAAGHL